MQDTGLTLNEAWNPREADLYASTLQLPISMRSPDNPLLHPFPANPAHLLFRPPTHPPVQCAARAATTRCARGAPSRPGPGQTFWDFCGRKQFGPCPSLWTATWTWSSFLTMTGCATRPRLPLQLDQVCLVRTERSSWNALSATLN